VLITTATGSLARHTAWMDLLPGLSESVSRFVAASALLADGHGLTGRAADWPALRLASPRRTEDSLWSLTFG
jgi:hypothetical protein